MFMRDSSAPESLAFKLPLDRQENRPTRARRDSRIVRESPPVSIHAETPSNGSLRKSESHRQSHSKLRPLRLAGGCEVQSELPGPPLRVTARQEQVGSAALSGLPFSLKYLVYASCFSTSAGALGRLPWGIQGLFQDSPSKVFSFQEEARTWSRWS